jgi:HAD superfamily hydrolase (TIGR01509 family)
MSLTLMPRPGRGPALRRPGARAGRARTWLALGIAGAGLGLVPWLAYLAISLPPSPVAWHWPAAWAGLDAMEAAGLVSTGVLLLRRDARACLTAAGTAALLLADAWFDVTTAPPGSGALTSLLMALLAELPAAALCAGLAIRGLGRPPISAIAPVLSDADHMAWAAACLVDVFDTIVTCDFAAHGDELSAAAGIAPHTWHAGFAEIAPALSTGRLSLEDGFAHILQAGGAEPRPGLVAELVRRDRERLSAAAGLYDDVIPFLGRLRERGVLIALVSNCVANTRPMLSALGVSGLADSLVLSCEIGWAKPSPQIYQLALDQLGVAAPATLFVDDQPAYCAGAAVLGISAVQIARRGARSMTPAAGTAVVQSLAELDAML